MVTFAATLAMAWIMWLFLPRNVQRENAEAAGNRLVEHEAQSGPNQPLKPVTLGSGPAGPQSTRLISLVQPYTATYPGAPADRISLQYAVMEVCRQAGVRCDWNQAFQQLGPLRTQWIYPAISNETFPAAMSHLLAPLGITYEMTADNSLILKRP